ncbi:tetratricopeptide repeat protein [Candidatus Methylospira mobilis]|uniref:O-linked N-acetylglucosamine transferase family protein n=1 Tax=Candidatus Methylospira mobilis TaxID=1808979 RepID=UPI0028EB360D|nr:tetratricopeptide repeat protein [Candidatus Methylospira mobilis]WNV03977.1 tetratricopeptide repeat protein [Candidatus Methylospira mobilis]
MYCAVIIPIAPEHEILAEETAFSVQFAFETDPGPFSDVFVIRMSNSGQTGQAGLLCHGARLAVEQGIEWLCFLHPDDILYPYAFQYLASHIENHDALFGLISEQLPDNLGISEQHPQLRKMDRLEDFLFHHPALTLRDSHFVRTQVALEAGSNPLADSPLGYRLRLWHRFSCRKIDQTLSVKRLGKTAHFDASAHQQLLDTYIALLADENAEKPDIAALLQKLHQFRQHGLLDQAAAIHKLIVRHDPQLETQADQENFPAYDLERYTAAFAAAEPPPGAGADFQQALQLDQQGYRTQAAAICKMILQQTPADTEALHLLGLMHCNAGHRNLGVEIMRTALDINPRNHQLWSNLGVSELGIPMVADALNCFDRAVILEIGYAPAWHGRAVALKELGRHEEAVASFNRALELDPENAETLSNRAITLRELKRFDEALASFELASLINPDYPFLQGNILHCRQLMCQWQGFDEIEKRVLQDVDAGKTVSTPFPFLAIASNPRQQRQCVERYAGNASPKQLPGQGGAALRAHQKIRLAYFSADFHTHAVAYLMAELFELHDRSRFEVMAFSYGPPSQDAIRRRLEQGFDRFMNLFQHSDQQIIELAHELEIDIAIDLSGHTRGSRLALFAQRLAPVQCHYLGYPGTLGTDYIDYLIADPVVISDEHLQHYTEKVAFLPCSFMVSDRRRAIDSVDCHRSEFGLPETAFVFCCFNNSYKITPKVFDIWMNILHEVEDSVLWLSRGNTWSVANIHKEAEQRGIAAGRIVFATHVERAEQHLARHRLAGLFLDTFYYGAHTTANDALWAGLPVLTCLGDTFAGRVAASLLSSLDLPELITHSPEEYRTRAIELARQPEKLHTMRSKLAANRTTSPLFDTPRFARRIEQVYTQMWQRQLAGLTPEYIHCEE